MKKENITITDDRLQLLDGYLTVLDSSAPSGINQSFIVNSLIDALCLMDRDIRMDLYAYCYWREQDLREDIANAEGVEQAKLIAKADEYERLVNILNRYGVIKLEPIRADLPTNKDVKKS